MEKIYSSACIYYNVVWKYCAIHLKRSLLLLTSVFPWLRKVCSINKVVPPFKSIFECHNFDESYEAVFSCSSTRPVLALGFLLPPWFWFILRFLHVWRHNVECQCNWNKKLKVVKPWLTPRGFAHKLVFFKTKSLETCWNLQYRKCDNSHWVAFVEWCIC